MECTIDDCGEKVKSNGWCVKHYWRWKRTGDPLALRRPSGGRPRVIAECLVDGCHAQVHSKGYCGKHYLRWRRYGDPLIARRVAYEGGQLEAFWASVDKRGPDECWPWTRPIHGPGYGQIRWDRRPQYAHRVSYILEHGSIPESGDPGDPIEIDHLCHTKACAERPCPHRKCVNPAHLHAKKRSENTARTAFWDPKVCREGCTCARHDHPRVNLPCPAGCTCRRHDGESRKCPAGCGCRKHPRRPQVPAMAM